MNNRSRLSGDRFAGEQAGAYRRGFVLGLTLAEAALLLIFVIMLLLITGFERRDREAAELRRQLEVLRSALPAGVDIEGLARDLQDLAELREVARSAGHEWNDDFIELVKGIAESQASAELVDAVEALRTREAELARAANLVAGLKSADDIKAMSKSIASQESLVANQRGQIQELLNRLDKSGAGRTLPSCWTDPDGHQVFLFDVVLRDQGISARSRIPEDRLEESKQVPIPAFDPEVIYGPGQFREMSTPLKKWGDEHECRFYVVRYDATGADKKDRYKELMRAVEDAFYKLQDDGPAPF